MELQTQQIQEPAEAGSEQVVAEANEVTSTTLPPAVTVVPAVEVVAAEPEPLPATPPADAAREPASSPEPVNVEVVAETASSISQEDRARFLLKEPDLWNKAGTIRVFSAARHDGQAGCVTASLPALRESGLVPEDASLAGGDILLIQVKNALLAWRVNRQNLASIATVWPVSLRMPQWRPEGGSEFIEYPAVVVGPVGYAKPLRMRRQPEPTPAASVAAPQEEVSAA